VRAVLILVVVLASGCALRPAPIANPSLSVVGKTAVRAAQVVNALDIAQRQIEPLVKAEVLTPAEGLNVARSFGAALEQAKALVAVLTVADAAQAVTEQLEQLRQAGGIVKQLLRSVGGATAGVAGWGGRIVVGSLAGSITDAVGELVPAGGAR
jgi:plasmid maintenance system antidote protein VapI